MTAVPLSISALSEEALVSSGIKEISALTLTTPGMITQQGVGFIEDPHEIEIRDARPILADLSLDREGFTLVSHRSEVAGREGLPGA